MNVAIASSRLRGARITAINCDDAKAWLDWLTNNGPRPPQTHDVKFALAHCDAGVTWGYLESNLEWKLGSAVDPDLCPTPTPDSLHELRLFGATAEVLLWRSDDGLQGRILTDDTDGLAPSDPLRPSDEGRRLRGEKRETHDGFTRYVDAGGAQHLAPAAFTEQFTVRHYFEQDPATGAARIAATRLLAEQQA